MGKRHGRPVIVSSVVACVALLSACGDAEPVSPQVGPLKTYVGKLDGYDANIALITDGDRVAGQVNDGNDVAVWLGAADLSDDDTATLTTREGLEVGEVDLDEQAAIGEFTLSVKTLSFEAELATGKAGFYVAENRKGEDSYQAGWIVLPDASIKGTLDTFIDGTVRTRAAPKLSTTINVPGIGSALPQELSGEYLNSIPDVSE